MSKRSASKELFEYGTRQQKRATTPVGLRVQLAVTDDTQTTKARTTGLAFRISGIQHSVTEAQLFQILDTLPCDEVLGQRNVLGMSFAPSAMSADTERYWTATVTFKSVPVMFRFPGASAYVNLVPNASPVIADKHFYGLTPLTNSPQPTIEYVSVVGDYIISLRKLLTHSVLLRLQVLLGMHLDPGRHVGAR